MADLATRKSSAQVVLDAEECIGESAEAFARLINHVIVQVEHRTTHLRSKGKARSTNFITDETLTAQIGARNTPEVYKMIEDLRRQLHSVPLVTRATPTTIQYGADAKGDFIPLLSFGAEYIWFQIPVRAVRSLGPQQFILCKQKINSVALFYRTEDVADPRKINALNPRYEILLGKIEAFVKVFSEVADTVRSAANTAS